MIAQGIFCILAAYLIGATPIGYLVGRAKGIDIRDFGSGNIGASNVLRTLGVKAGLAVWIVDVFKGWLPVWAAGTWQPVLHGQSWLAAVGLGAVVGHSFSPYLGMKGGRGVSTALGVVLALNFPAGLTAFGLWIVIVALTRYISLGSIVASLSCAPMLLLFQAPQAYFVPALAVGLLITWRHTPNIQRLLTGTETKIGQKAKELEVDEGTEADE